MPDEVSEVGRADSAGGHDADTIGRGMAQARDAIRSLKRVLSAARGEDAISATRDHVFKCQIEIGAEIERAMEGDGQGVGQFHQLPRALCVDTMI